MFSLKPKEGGSTTPPPAPANTNLLKGGIALALLLILGLGYNAYSSRVALQNQIDTLQSQLEQQTEQMTVVKKRATDMGADIDVVTKRLGVTSQELDVSRKFAERLKAAQEKAQEQLATELATKASSSDVAAARQEATTKAAEVQQVAEAKIGNVSGEVKTVADNLESTRKDLAESRREITDVKTNLSAQIARNSGELADLRKKGERDFFEFDLKKPKKNEMTRVADIQLQLRKTDPKKAKYDMLIQVDDSKLEKKERTANEPVQFLVGRDKLRYEVVVNFIDKDRVRGYVSAPKDKALAAERPQFRPE
jgi:flagellar motor switch/type III secretory pathway protein FliN